ncbi:hypothetical protein H8E88_35345 [candidate division KSB1 bacterium]|nr:hypothetical protein [candidate division KSB1 bacterium]
MLEYWSDGVLDYWSNGLVEFWSDGVMDCWIYGLENAHKKMVLPYFNSTNPILHYSL